MSAATFSSTIMATQHACLTWKRMESSLWLFVLKCYTLAQLSRPREPSNASNSHNLQSMSSTTKNSPNTVSMALPNLSGSSSFSPKKQPEESMKSTWRIYTRLPSTQKSTANSSSSKCCSHSRQNRTLSSRTQARQWAQSITTLTCARFSNMETPSSHHPFCNRFLKISRHPKTSSSSEISYLCCLTSSNGPTSNHSFRFVTMIRWIWFRRKLQKLMGREAWMKDRESTQRSKGRDKPRRSSTSSFWNPWKCGRNASKETWTMKKNNPKLSNTINFSR